MLYCFVRVTDHKEKKHFEKELKLEEQTTLRQLKEKISSLWSIEPDLMKLYFYGGREICDIDSSSQIAEIGIRDRDTVIVKHSHLDHWITYLNHVDEFNNSQVSETKKQSAENAQRLYDLLLGSYFFMTYPLLDIEVIRHHRPIHIYLDKSPQWMKDSATHFFNCSMFKGQNPVIEFERNNDGTRLAMICNINVNSITHKYRIKTNHNAGERANRWNLMIELYCYKLLEAINMGPKIVFIPNIATSKSIMYIGSEWMPEFQSFKSIKQVDPAEITHAILQIHFLAVFLSFGDMHEKNFGFNGSDPIIVDFTMTNCRNPENDFLHNEYTIYSPRARDILQNLDANSRLQVAEDAVEKWNLLDKMTEVLELMEKEKEDFGREMLDFEKKTNDLEDYVKRVKLNIQDLFFK